MDPPGGVTRLPAPWRWCRHGCPGGGCRGRTARRSRPIYRCAAGELAPPGRTRAHASVQDGRGLFCCERWDARACNAAEAVILTRGWPTIRYTVLVHDGVTMEDLLVGHRLDFLVVAGAGGPAGSGNRVRRAARLQRPGSTPRPVRAERGGKRLDFAPTVVMAAEQAGLDGAQRLAGRRMTRRRRSRRCGRARSPASMAASVPVPMARPRPA